MGLGYKDPWTLTDAQVDQVSTTSSSTSATCGRSSTATRSSSTSTRAARSTAGFGYHDYPVTLKRAGEPVAFTDAEGSIAWVCGYALSAKTTNLNAAYALMNWYITPQIQKYYVDQYTYLWVNQKATPLISPTLVQADGDGRPRRDARRTDPRGVAGQLRHVAHGLGEDPVGLDELGTPNDGGSTT